MFIWIVFIGIAVISYLVQSSLQSKFEKYSQIPLSNGMTGREVAEKMLRDNGSMMCGYQYGRNADRPL